ncbi:male accessory gland serine protease inhibitor [Musca domestica]|uniref:Male accessory gland serine protease inhibitor n=1 Tax=Musca domestica TaxID=7370 RepID=A0A1I8N434_MUSDO|nr:male accessory gland serine protease inhibitor [Musca domestica]
MKIFAILLIAIAVILHSSVALKNTICGLEHSKTTNSAGASCYAMIPSWSYNADAKECIHFVYGGCNGNENRFRTKEECLEMCAE